MLLAWNLTFLTYHFQAKERNGRYIHQVQTIYNWRVIKLLSIGRPPWYDSQGQHVDAFVIGLSGGSASGKTTVAKKIIESLHVEWVCLLSMDSFYKVLTPEQCQAAANNEYNFDHPGI